MDNIVCDFMHDIPEGVARYDMAVIINHLIIKKYFTLDILNKRIELFNYGITERKNIPPSIIQNNLKKGYIIMSASEMLCLVRYFGLKVGDLIPRETELWRLYLNLHKIIDLCCARKIQPECAAQIDSIVAEHNRLYIQYSETLLKPKFHILTHYGRLLLKNGPIILTSVIRFEAKHKILKSIANAIPCRINLGYTLARKLQLQTMNRLLTLSGLQPDLKVGPGKSVISKIELTYNVYKTIPSELVNESYKVSWVEYKGIYYKIGLILVIQTNLDGCLFGEIDKILVGKSRVPYFIIKPLISIGFDSHFHAHEVNFDHSNIDKIGYYINELDYPYPIAARTVGNNKTYVLLR